MIEMKRILTWLVIGLSVMMGTVSGAVAQDFQKDVEAHQKIDYATAFQEWRALAEQGNFNCILAIEKILQ